MFRNSQDRIPVAVIVTASVFDVFAYLVLDGAFQLATYWLVMLIPKGIISAWNHHHQHVPTFRRVAFNRVYEMLLAFHTGVSTNLWVLHHNIGHHVNFLDQEKDQSAWKTKSGRTMGMLEYTFTIAATAHYRSYLVGRKYPKHLRPFLVWGAITFLVVALAVFARPLHGLFLYVLPMVTSLLFTCWVTYDHHSGLEADDPFQASHNILNPAFNWLTGNLGYHTAHHHRQAVHWSQLPALHAAIEDKIPPHLFRKTTFDALLPSVVGR